MRVKSRFLGYALLLPRNSAIAFILVYRKIVSPLYGDVCRYYPSCSTFGLGEIQSLGLLLGGAKTIWRIVRCNPWSSGGVDEPAQLPSHLALRRLGFVSPQLAE